MNHTFRVSIVLLAFAAGCGSSSTSPSSVATGNVQSSGSAPPATQSATPTSSNEINLLGCSQEGTVKSVSGVTLTTLTFINTSNAIRKVFWLDYSGQRQLWFTLNGLQTAQQGSWVTHPWLVTDASNVCLGIWVTPSGGGTITLR